MAHPILIEPQQRHAAHGLALAAALTPPLTVYLPGVAAVIGALVGAFLLLQALRQRRWPASPGTVLIDTLAVFLGYALLSATWSIKPSDAMGRWVELVAITATGLVLLGAANLPDASLRRRVGVAALSGVAATAALLLVEAIPGRGLRETLFPSLVYRVGEFNRAATLLVIFAWPALAGLPPRRRVLGGIALLILVAAAAFLSESAAARVAFAAGLAAFALVWLAGRIGLRMVGIGIIVGIVLAPLIVHVLTSTGLHAWSRWFGISATHREVIWSFTTEQIAEQPLFGWGLDSARTIPGGRMLISPAELPQTAPDLTYLPLHPHNAALQLWLELGLAGALGGGTLVAVALRGMERRIRSRFDRAVLAGVLASATAIACLSYGMWQGWWVMSLWLVASISAAVVTAPEAETG